jgi:hypothetical protein
MLDRPEFEIVDGAVVHPLIAPLPGKMSARERADAERGAAWAYWFNGGAGEPWHCYGGRAPEERER